MNAESTIISWGFGATDALVQHTEPDFPYYSHEEVTNVFGTIPGGPSSSTGGGGDGGDGGSGGSDGGDGGKSSASPIISTHVSLVFLACAFFGHFLAAQARL